VTDIRKAVRNRYGEIAAGGPCTPGCCSTGTPCSTVPPEVAAAALGYSQAELSGLPEGANLGLGCGNPQAIAALKPGQTVLDLGSGGGIDCFLAARQVGPVGRVIGVDMTAEMIERARAAGTRAGASNVEFRLGEIEHLPVADQTVDVVLSNCVINLSPDKPAVFREAFRVLKSGGRLAISDIMATAPMPPGIRDSVELHVRCVAGAATIEEVEAMLAEAGFTEIRITPMAGSAKVIRQWMPDLRLDEYIVSATVEAIRP